jgi:hypothetical protein
MVDFTSVNRDSAGIYLCCGGQGCTATWAWIGVDDVTALFHEYSLSSARIRGAPRNYPWALVDRTSSPTKGSKRNRE